MAYNVLIADDSQTTRRIIAKALRHAGVPLGEIREASDGIEALALLEDSWVDIVFADLNMPRMGGVELVERMAEIDLLSSVPVVIVSTEGRQDRIDALLSRGVAAYVRKPFSPEQLASTVSELLSSKHELPVVDELEEAFFGAIEGFTMMVAEPLAEAPQPPARIAVARMRLVGSTTIAEVAIALPENGCTTIAEMATGEPDANGGCDALMELLNVTCGHLVDVLGGGPFQMDPPLAETVAGADAWPAITEMQVSLAFDVEGMPLVIGMNVTDRW